MKCAVYCLSATQVQANRIIRSLTSAKFTEISVLLTERDERTATPVHAEAYGHPVSGVATRTIKPLDLISGIGAVHSAEAGRLVAGGPLLTTLYGALAASRESGSRINSLADCLAGAGIPHYEARRYADDIIDHAILILVQVHNPSDIERVELIYHAAGADAIACATQLEPLYS
jgi:hypothetical protein